MSGAAVLRIDRATAKHLAVAIRRHRQVAKLQDIDVPPGLEDIEAWAWETVKGHSERSGRVTVGSGPDDRNMTELMTPAAVASATGLSASTIKRRLRDGSLQSVKIGRSRRIRRGDLTQFLEGFEAS